MIVNLLSVMSPSCKQIGPKGMFRSKVCLCTSAHVCVPGQTGRKGQCPTSRRLPAPRPGRLQPQEVPRAAVVFEHLKVSAPRAKTPLAWNFLLRCRKVFIRSYQCWELSHFICTDAGIMYFCKEKQTYDFQKNGIRTVSCLGVQLVWLGLLTAGVTYT